jgi:hypothetical protein
MAARCSCGEPVHGRGMCRRHYWQWKDQADRDGTFTSLRGTLLRRQRGDRVQYRCTKCETWRDVSQFQPRVAGGHVVSHCKPCIKEYAAKRTAQTTPAERRKQNRKRRDRVRASKRIPDKGINQPRRLIDPVPLQAMIVERVQRQGVDSVCAGARVNDRWLRRLMHDTAKVDFNKTERVCIELGITDALYTATGIDHEAAAWSRHGHICCDGCGTSTILHRARGLCDRCYHREMQQRYRDRKRVAAVR